MPVLESKGYRVAARKSARPLVTKTQELYRDEYGDDEGPIMYSRVVRRIRGQMVPDGTATTSTKLARVKSD